MVVFIHPHPPHGQIINTELCLLQPQPSSQTRWWAMDTCMVFVTFSLWWTKGNEEKYWEKKSRNNKQKGDTFLVYFHSKNKQTKSASFQTQNEQHRNQVTELYSKHRHAVSQQTHNARVSSIWTEVMLTHTPRWLNWDQPFQAPGVFLPVFLAPCVLQIRRWRRAQLMGRRCR